MPSISRALIVILSIMSTHAYGESRFIGAFDTQGMGVLVDTGPKVPKAKAILPAGHLPNPELTLPVRTRQRFSTSASDTRAILKEANARFEEKLNELRADGKLIRMAKEVGPIYGVDPAVIVAAVAGELTFNNDFSMKLQSMAAYIPSQKFYPGATEVLGMFPLAQMQTCKPERQDYWSWTCLNVLWNQNVAVARGMARPVKNLGYIPMKASEVAFANKVSPVAVMMSMGNSFGPAQITLMRALMMSDDVTRFSKGKFPRVTIENMPAVQRMVSDVEASLHIVAATLARSIYAYRKYARVDISGNLGIQATLFNLGFELEHSLRLQHANMWTKVMSLPRENYFGWYMNEHEKEIRALLAEIR